jgi:hypothetical protein
MHDQEDDEDEKLLAEMQHAAANLPPRRHGKGGKDTFVKVPLWWLEQVTRAVQSPQQAFVAVWLLHLAWKAKSAAFPVPNGQLERYGVGRHTKYRALACLEAAGLISVERPARKTPRVTLLVM